MTDLLLSNDAAHGARPRMRLALLIVAGWTFVAVAITQVQLLAFAQTGFPVVRLRLLGWNLWSCWLWAVFTPAILVVARRFPVERATWPRAAPAHLAALLALAALDALGNSAVAPWLCPYPEWPTLGGFFLQHLPVNAGSYLVVAALGHAGRYAALYRDRRLAALRLEAELAEARLAALQGQLQPHFLFNTLNAIAEQVHLDPHAADAMILRLGKLLRASLQAPGRSEVALRDELALTADYLELMRLRLRDRLVVRVEAPDALLDAPVPALVLQPLVENAIRHGVERRAGAGTIDVVARTEGDLLVLEVRDDGAGLAADASEGVGLANTRARLRQIHGAAGRLAMHARPTGGVAAVVSLPLPAGMASGRTA
jgi:signal transduction histidine kinase